MHVDAELPSLLVPDPLYRAQIAGLGLQLDEVHPTTRHEHQPVRHSSLGRGELHDPAAEQAYPLTEERLELALELGSLSHRVFRSGLAM
jgi:hypothetical protein